MTKVFRFLFWQAVLILQNFSEIWGKGQHAAVSRRQAVRTVQSGSLTRLHQEWNGLPEIPGSNWRAGRGRLGLPGCRCGYMHWWCKWHGPQCSSHTRRWCWAPYPVRETHFCWALLGHRRPISTPKGSCNISAIVQPDEEYTSSWEIPLTEVWTWAKCIHYSSGKRAS